MASPPLFEQKDDGFVAEDGDDAGDGAGGGVGALDGILGFHIRLAHGAVYRHFTETFADLGLTQKQSAVLWVVGDHPGISQIEVGRRLRMDRATTMTIVNRLQERDYLRRERSEQDGRKQALHLTDEGEGGLQQARNCIAEHEAWLKARFSEEETEKLVEMLSRIHE